VSEKASAPVVVVRVGKDGTPFFEAKWRDADRQQVKRRLGPAWVESGGEDGWRKRRGRTPAGWLDERAAHVAAAEKVAEVERERAEAARARAREGVPTFRRVAHEWLEWKRDVKGGAPSTLRENARLLRDPGEPKKRGDGTAQARLMERFGDRPHDEITTREVSDFLRKLDAELSPRMVNEHRAVLHSIFTYAMKPDTYALAVNPVSGIDKRYQPPPPHSTTTRSTRSRRWRARASAASSVATRATTKDGQSHSARRSRQRGRPRIARTQSCSRRCSTAACGSARSSHFLPDLSGAVIDVERAVSAGVVKEPKGRRGRQVPIPRPAAEALARLGQRDEFTGPEDYAFCNRLGGLLNPSALRRRYKRAADAAGLRPVKLHGLRHAAGSVLARTLPLVTVRDLLGHAELRTTNRYLHSKIDLAAIVAVNAAFGVTTDAEDRAA
jgi:integrase